MTELADKNSFTLVHQNEELRQKLLNQLKRHEGTKRNASGEHIAYRCPAGKLTIGYGHNLDANPVPGLGEHSVIDEEWACLLLDKDVCNVEASLRRKLPWIVLLPFTRYAVLVNMAFNIGLTSLMGFKNTLEMTRKGEYAAAAKGMLQSKWATQVKSRAEELARQMDTGEMRA